MSIDKYPTYKATGLEWLEIIPCHWEVKRLKQFCNVFPSNVDKKTVEGETPVRLCNYTDVYYNDFVGENLEFMAATATEEQIAKFSIKAGDTIITKDSETADDIAIAAYAPQDLPGVICGYHLSMVRPKEAVNGAFVKRLFDSAYTKALMAVRANGLTRVGLSQYAIDNAELPLPPKEEQTSIAAFLDRETAKIDALIAVQQRLIELLQEKRQAVVSHAVTKGLNPNAPMKDSGVEWLGQVPEHWNLLRGRFLYTKREEATQNSDEVVTAFRDGQVIQRNLRRVDGFTLAELEVGYQHVCIGDLVIHGMDAFAGAIGVSESEGKCTPEYSVCHPIDSSHSNTYFAHALRVMARREYIYVICPSVRERAPRFRFSTFKDVVLPVPPSAEQESISKSITDECSRLSELASSAEALMAVLNERRSALISAAVTGQIDVRGLLEVEAGEQ